MTHFGLDRGRWDYINFVESEERGNRSTQDFRYLEFFTSPPLSADFVEVK